MEKITIDPELRDWIIPLSEEEKVNLEKSISEDGCRDPLIVWNGVLVDGHHRYEICTRNGIPFSTISKEFEDKDSAKIWMVNNQLARRNLQPLQRIALCDRVEPLIAVKARKNMQLRQPLYLNVSNGLANLPNHSESLNIESPPLSDTPDTSIQPTEPQKPTHTQTAPKIIKPVDTRKESAKHAGVSPRTYAMGKEVLQKAAPEVVAKVMKGEVSIYKAHTDIRRDEKKEERQKDIIENPVVPDGTYNVLLADPPWRYEFSETTRREIENQYPTMDLDAIKALELPLEDDCILFLWATAPKLEEAMQVLNSWGFTYKTCAIWDKEKMGMGYWFRIQHELLLVGVRGNVRAPETDARFQSVIRSPRSTHSSKPEVVYEMIEQMFPNKKYLEAFARSNREGWSSWGNQV